MNGNNKERQENKLPGYLAHPFDRFLKLDVNFLILTQSDPEARILRVIECCVEYKRQQYQSAQVTIPEEIWCAISHGFFLDQLHGTIQSETTLKEALTNLENKYLIFKRPGGGHQYDAPLYTLNKRLIAKLYTLFPENFTDIDMASIMKKPRKQKDPGGQKLTPSKIDPLVQKLRESIFDPINHQFLTPLTPISELGGGQKLTPIRKKKDIQKNNNRVATRANDAQEENQEDATVAALSSQFKNSLTDEELDLILQRRRETQNQQMEYPQPVSLPQQEKALAEMHEMQKVKNNDKCEGEGKEAAVPNQRSGNQPPIVIIQANEDADAGNGMHEEGQANNVRETRSVAREQASPSAIPTQPEPVTQQVTPAVAPSPSPEPYVQVVEQLRGQPYGSMERAREVRAARELLKQISPLTGQPVTPEEVSIAWQHSSDERWQNAHNGENMHVHDLMYHNSHNTLWIVASLEHWKQRRALTHRTGNSPIRCSPPSAPVPSRPTASAPMTKEEAETLATQIVQDGVRLKHDFRACVRDEDGAWIVQFDSRQGKRSLRSVLRAQHEWKKECAETHELFVLEAERLQRQVEREMRLAAGR